MTYTADFLIAKRKEKWQEKKSIEYDKELRNAIADEMLSNGDLLAEIKRNPEKLIELVFIVVDKNQKTTPFFLNDVQHEFMNTLNKAIQDFNKGDITDISLLVLKGRQQGFTTLVTAYQLACSILNKNFQGYTLADKSDNSEAIFQNKAKFPYSQLPEALKPTEKYNNRKQLLFEKINSSWAVDTATKDVGRSRTVNFFHGSECAFWKDGISPIQGALGEAFTKNCIKIYESIKQLNSDVNYNMEELIGNSETIKQNVADKDNRHAKQGISSFDSRTVKFYDGSKAYDVEFSIATLQNGEKIAYAKKYFGYDAELTKKIQTAEVRSKQSPLNQRSATNSISQKSEKSSDFSKKSLSSTEDIAPIGNFNVYGKDVILEAPVRQDIAPAAQTEATASKSAPATKPAAETKKSPYADKDISPVMTEEEMRQLRGEPNISDLQREYDAVYRQFADASKTDNIERLQSLAVRLDELNQQISQMEAEESARNSEALASLEDTDAPPEMEAPYYGENTVTADSPFANRDIKEVGNRNVKAYMYENPEVKPFFQAEAEVMMGELQNTVKGERWYNDEVYYETNGEAGFGGVSRQTTADIAYLLDNLKMSYADIEKGLNAIIEDNGAENIASAKRIEFVLNDRLLNGYEQYGYDIPANQDYINLLNEKQITEYNEEARKSFFESADFYAPDDNIAPVAKAETVSNEQGGSKQADIAPTFETTKSTEVKGQQTLFAEEKSTSETAANNGKSAQILAGEHHADKKKNRTLSHAARNLVDKFSVFETLSYKTKNKKLRAKVQKMRDAEAAAQYFIGKGAEGVRSMRDLQAEVVKSGHNQEFQEYMYQALNIDRMTLEDRYENVTNKTATGDSAEVSRAKVTEFEAKYPQFKKWAQECYDNMTYLRSKLVEDGVISQELADKLAEMYPHYVPIRRADKAGVGVNVPLFTGKTGVNTPLKRATGGTSAIEDLFDTMAMRAEQTFKAVAKNSFGVELKNTLGSTIQKTKTTDLDEILDSVENHDGLLKKAENGKNPTFTVFENGERVEFEITEDMYEALLPTSKAMSETYKIPSAISKGMKGVLTEYNPLFMVTNAIKDAQDMLINSQHPAATYKAIPKAIQALWQKENNPWYAERMANGGANQTYFDRNKNTFAEDKTGVRKWIGKISDANNFIEQIPRMAEYIASREAGATVEEAMLDSANVTTNFSAGGDVTKWASRNGATFLNASVQGAAQQVRNIREANEKGLKGWVGLAAKVAIAGLPVTLLNHLLWDDDEEYEELSDYVKDNYYVVAKTADGTFIRIPKGRTMAVIQDAFEQMENAITGNDEVDFENFFQLVINNLAPNNPLDNNILAPIYQAATNRTWYGEDLVPTRLQDLPNEEQYDESTDAFSKWLGETFGISPYKANYVLDQYTGGIGDVFLPMMTPEAESGDNSLWGNMIAPFKDKFTTDSVMNNQNVSDFYDTVDELTTNAKSSKATDEDVLKYKYMNSVNAELGELYAQKRKIQSSDLEDDAKYSSVREIQKQIDALAKESLNAYNDVYIEDGYAMVGDRFYRLNDDGEWQKISDDQSKRQEEVTSALGISGSDYWSNKDEYDFAYEYPDKYAVAKAVGGYETYRTFASDLSDIKADKDEDGITISGSRKEKVIAYLNDLNADYGEKIILFKSVYTADDTYNSEIIEYLNSRTDISYSEKEAILKELGFTVHSDGRVTW